MAHYTGAVLAELIDALYEQERQPDLELIRALLKRGAEAVPALIEIVESDHDWAQIHAALLLCELRAEPALPALQRAISAPKGRDLADWLSDDALDKFGPVALDLCETVAADKKVDWYPRDVACQVMATVAFRYPETYPRVTAFLRGLLPDPGLDWRSFPSYEAVKRAVDDPKLWTTVVCRLCDLRDPQAYDVIGELFRAGLIDEMVIEPADYQRAYQRSAPPATLTKKPLDLLARYQRKQR